MADSTVVQASPPYASYDAWKKMLDQFRQNLPNRIDNSCLEALKTEQPTRSTLYTALRFLQLMHEDRSPTKALTDLLHVQGEDYKRQLRDIIREAYKPVLEGLRLPSATPEQLKEIFLKRTNNEERARKCLSFFVAIATEAELPLSTYVLRRRRRPVQRVTVKSSSPSKEKAKAERSPSQGAPALAEAASPSDASSLALILDMFPEYDPSWSDEAVMRWRETIAILLKAAGFGEVQPAQPQTSPRP